MESNHRDGPAGLKNDNDKNVISNGILISYNFTRIIVIGNIVHTTPSLLMIEA